MMSNLLDMAGGLALMGVALAGLLALAVWLAKAPAGDLRVVDDAPAADEQPRSLLALHPVNAPARQWLASRTQASTQPAAPSAHVGYAAQGQPLAPRLSDTAVSRLVAILTDDDRWAEFPPTGAERDALN